MDQTKRMLLAVALSFGLIAAVQWLFPQEMTNPEAPKTAEPAPSQPTPVQAPTVAPAAVPSVAEGNAVALPEVKTIKIERQEVHYSVSTQGAGWTRAQLQGPKMRQALDLSIKEGFAKLVGKPVREPGQIDMGISAADAPLPFSFSIEGASPFPAETRYAVEESNGQLTFTARHGTWEVIKRVSFAPNGFEFNYGLELKNIGAQPAEGKLVMHSVLGVDPTKETAPSMFAGLGNQARATCFVDDSLKHIVPKEGEVVTENHAGPVRFVGIDQSYFMAALFPLDQALAGECRLKAGNTVRQADLALALKAAPGETVKWAFGGFMGPKDAELLGSIASDKGQVVLTKSPSEASYRPMLEKSIDFGMFEIICRLLLGIMKMFFRLTGNWGVAVILLTVLVKLALLPLTHKSMVSAENMKKLQPKVEEVKKKFADDRERQNMEMMKVYQEAKVNPMAGCLPMLLQMPVWIALFTTLRTSYELYREPFFGPLYTDLTAKDPTFFLPLALGVTMIITQMLQPQMMDATQAKIMTWFMPIMFTGLMLQYPAGLTLYIFTNNVLSIVQQYGLRKYLENKGISAPQQKPNKKLLKGKA